MNRQEAYKTLVNKRKSCALCALTGLVNPSSFNGLDSDQIGPWSRWQGNLNAEIMVVGQDWGGIKYFEQNQGDDQLTNNPTNAKLRMLLLNKFGIDIQKQNINDDGAIFLTNTILCLKKGALQDPIKQEWLSNCSKNFFRQLAEIIQPKIIIALGKPASKSILNLYNISYSKSAPLRNMVNEQPIKLTESMHLIPMFHCGARVINSHRPIEKQLEDWGRAAEWFRTSYVAGESKRTPHAGL